MRTKRTGASPVVSAITVLVIGLVVGMATIGALYELVPGSRGVAPAPSPPTTSFSTSSVIIPTSTSSVAFTSSTSSTTSTTSTTSTPTPTSTTTSTTVTPSPTTTSTTSTSTTSTSSSLTSGAGIFIAQFSPTTPIFYSGIDLNYSLSVQVVGGTATSLALSVTGPAGITFNLYPGSVSLAGGGPPPPVIIGAQPSTSLAAGMYPVTITATGGGGVYTASLNIQVVKYLVVVSGGSYSPATLTVPVGSTVTWLRLNGALSENDDGTNNIDFTTGNIPASPGLAQDGSYSYTFTTAGTYPYISQYRTGMSGTIIVTS